MPNAPKTKVLRFCVRFLTPRKVLSARDAHRILSFLTVLRRSSAFRVTLVVAPDAWMRRMNRRYHGRDRTTDVLAFDLGFSRSEGARLADIMVGADAARRAARDLGVPAREEMVRYIVHGFLHLWGYDDARPRERQRMWRRQEALVSSLLRRLSRRKVVVRP